MTPPAEKSPRPSGSATRFWKRVALTFAAVILFHAFFDIPGFFYDERGCDIPADPVEKAAYDYAHSLKLPDSVPQNSPYFPFWWARLVALIPGAHSVDEAYFRHLCEYEAGDYVFKTIENVEGVFQLRPRKRIYGTPIDYDRYRLEEPTRVGSGDDNSIGWAKIADYVQPKRGVYVFLEQPPPTHAGGVTRYIRGQNEHPPDGYRNGVSAGSRNGKPVYLRFAVVKEEDVARRARYGFTWRGIKRPHDRRYSIAAGEHLIVDLDTNEVLAVKRAFKISGWDKNTKSGIWRGNAMWCKGKEWDNSYLVRETLKPVPYLNERYLQEHPPVELKDLHKENK